MPERIQTDIANVHSVDFDLAALKLYNTVAGHEDVNRHSWVIEIPEEGLHQRAFACGKVNCFRTSSKKYTTYQLQYDLLLRPVYSSNQTVVDGMRNKSYFLSRCDFKADTLEHKRQTLAIC